MRGRARKVQCSVICSLSFLFICFFPVLAKAATFCVSTSAELNTALSDAAGNGQDDVVRIVHGTYQGNFVYASAEAFDLTIEGGYVAGCTSREVDPANTVLDGMGTETVLVLSASQQQVDCTVDGLTLRNGSSRNGGGLYIPSKGNITLTNNVISGNSGGGIYVYDATTVNLTSNTITDNSSQSGGGGVHVYNVSSFLTGKINLTNNTITGNSSQYIGGGVSLSYGAVTLTNNTISENSSSGSGGGAYIYVYSNTATLTNNTISKNSSSGSGGGIVIDRANAAILTNNTITGNSAVSGGGIWLLLDRDDAPGDIYNNIIWANTASSSQGADLYLINDSDNNFIPSPVNLFNNDFDQSSPGGIYIKLPFPIDSSNLNNLDPLFVNSLNGDYHLQAGSPVINRGNNAAPALPITDKDGNPRIADCVVDLGAFELPGTGVGGCPVADAGGPYSGMVGEAISFDGSGSFDSDGVIVSWTWDFGDGTGGSGETATHSYRAPGTYTVTLTVTDNSGLSSTDTATVEVRAPQPPGLALTLTGCTICRAGDRFTVQAHATNPGSQDVPVEIKVGVRMPDGTTVNLNPVGNKHWEIPLPAGLDTTLTLFDIPSLPDRLPTGTWTFEGTLLGPDLGETFSREVKPFEVVQ